MSGEKSTTEVAISDARIDAKHVDVDAQNLAVMGYAAAMPRNFSTWSILGVGFALTNSWFAISAALVTGIASGGPVLLIYGILAMAALSTCVGASLAELASALPNAGGQYYWAGELAAARFARFAAYATGWTAWAGSLFTSASVALAVGSGLVGCWQLSHPDFVILPWHVFAGYQVVNAFAFVFNCYGRGLPRVATASLYISLLSFAVLLIVVPAKAPTHQQARVVFATFTNNTGWASNGIAAIVGLVNANWAFACLDAATHLAEEVQRPERAVPLAIMGTVAIGAVTSWCFAVAMFFSMQDLAAVVATPTLVPMLALFDQAVAPKAAAIALEALVLATGIGCLIASHTWQSRLCWSFARDRGLPCDGALSAVHPTLNVPLNAHIFSSAIVAGLGCLYLGSYTAFNSMVTASIVLLYISYAIPVGCLVLRGRNTIVHGPFWLGRAGLVANYVLLAWTVFTLVMYSWPPVYPATASNMNYVSAVYAVVVLIIAIDWFTRGRRHFRGQTDRRRERGEVQVEQVVR